MNLLKDNILGIITSQGFIDSINTGDEIKMHGEYFELGGSCRWRWDNKEGLWWITGAYKPDEEQQEAIRRHLTKKYGIKWLENGYHNEQALQVRFEEGVTFTKKGRGWIAERNGLDAEGKTKEKAIYELLITEMYSRIANKS